MTELLPSTEEKPVGDPDPPVDVGTGDLVVLPADDASGLALVLGGGPITSELGTQLETLPQRFVKRLTENAGLAGRFAGAFDADHGRWVRLTAESAAKLKKHGINTDGGGVGMGVLRGSDGRFTHVTRWDVVSPVPFDPGTFVAAMAVQQVVKQIEQKLEEIAAGVDALLQGSKYELEAKLAASHDVIVRIERRVRDRGLVDPDDWASLANLEPIVKEAYHQTFRWLDPLRDFLSDGELSLVEEVKLLRGNHGLKDVEFWLRMHLHSELALKRWEALYLIREADVAPERLAGEAEEVRRRAEQRHDELMGLLDALASYLDQDPDAGLSLPDRVRFISRHRLARLRVELTQVANAYAEALRRASVDVPVYLEAKDPGPLIDPEAVQDYLKTGALPALQAGTETAARWAGQTRRAASKWVRGARDRPQADDESEKT